MITGCNRFFADSTTLRHYYRTLPTTAGQYLCWIRERVSDKRCAPLNHRNLCTRDHFAYYSLNNNNIPVAIRGGLLWWWIWSRGGCHSLATQWMSVVMVEEFYQSPARRHRQPARIIPVSHWVSRRDDVCSGGVHCQQQRIAHLKLRVSSRNCDPEWISRSQALNFGSEIIVEKWQQKWQSEGEIIFLKY